MNFPRVGYPASKFPIGTGALKKSPVERQLSVLLETREVRRIGFLYGSVRVDGDGFAQVAAEVRTGRIGVNDAPGSPTNGALAEYWIPNPSEFRFDGPRALQSVKGRSLAVHEACHAMLDVKYEANPSVVMELLDEGAAYIAQIWYQIETGYQNYEDNALVLRQTAEALRARKKTAHPHLPSATKSEIQDVGRFLLSLPGKPYGNDVRRYDGL